MIASQPAATKERAVLAVYTVGDVLWTAAIFLIWIAFFAVGLWLLVRLFRNTKFIPRNRALRIAVKVLLVVFTVFVPVLGVLVLFVIWYSTRSGDDELPDAGPAGPAAPPTGPSADGATYHRPLPFPPRSTPEDKGA